MFTDNFVDFVRFTQAAMEDLDKGNDKDFKCPLCGGRAHASRISNGQLSARCSECKASVEH